MDRIFRLRRMVSAANYLPERGYFYFAHAHSRPAAVTARYFYFD
jgi:hypothetical protein